MEINYKGGYRKDGQCIVLQKKSEDLCKACKPSNADSGIAYAQLFDFRGYTYEPETDVIELHSPKADKLISQL